MKHVARIGFLIMAGLLVAIVATRSEPKSTPEPVVLPAALDNFYPPRAPAPEYLINMIQLATPFSGLVSDLMQGDTGNVGKTFNKFRMQYTKVARMISEWESSFPIAPIDELGAALNTMDPGKVMVAVDKVGKVCNTCHIAVMAAAQQRYHWGDFNDITITDPLSKQSVPFSALMQMIDVSFSGIETDLEQGQIENAKANTQALKARFGELKETCQACHDTERQYFIDRSVTDRIDQLQSILGSSPVDQKAVGALIQSIGMESCHKCHLVHMPAAYSKFKLDETKSAH